MKKTIMIVVTALSMHGITAQNISNHLSGYFKNNTKDGLYSSIYLDGRGHAIISDAYSAEYFQLDNTLYVFPDKSVFIFKVEKDKLKGVSSWVEKQTYKSSAVPKTEEPMVFPSYTIQPDLLHKFYLYNFTEGTDEASFSAFEDMELYIKNMEELCNKGLTAACGSLFGMKYLEASGGLDSVLEGNTAKFKDDKTLPAIANRMINLGDVRGYSLLGSYYYAIGNEEKAREVYTKGSDNGDTQSALILFNLDMEKSMQDMDNAEEITEE